MAFDKPLSEVVEGAAEELRTHGWNQGFMFGSDGSICILGAMIMAGYSKGGEDIFKDCGPLVEYFPPVPMPVHAAPDWMSITEWNDKVASSQVEVEDRLMEIAKDLRNKGK